MRKGFINGLFAGGLLGAVVTMFVAPQFKKNDMMQETMQAGHRARRVIKGVKNIADDWMK